MQMLRDSDSNVLTHQGITRRKVVDQLEGG